MEIMKKWGCCGSRLEPEVSGSSTGEAPREQPQAQVGVGIVFQADALGALAVKSLAVGGPADKSREIMIGDTLHEIDGINVFQKPLSMLSALILGAPGTTVRLGLQRGTNTKLVFVELKRSWTMVGPVSVPRPAGR